MFNNTITIHKNNEVLYKYQTSFMSEEESNAYREKCYSGNKKKTLDGTIQSFYFKHCEECGKLYWNPQFQLDEVKYCVHHNTRLKKSLIRRNSNDVHLNTKLEKGMLEHSRDCIYTDAYKEHFIWIANQTNIILERNYIKRELSWIKSKYKSILQKLGYANLNGRIKVKILMREFFRFYDHEFLEILSLDFDECTSSNWLIGAFRSNNTIMSPLKHLLILRFLGEGFEGFINDLILTYNPFGTGGWECLNPVCVYRYEKVITDIVLDYSIDTKSCRGLFKHGCGYEYYKYENSNTIRIKNRGILWETKLYELIKENRSLRSIAKLLNCDSKTVIRIADHLGINHRWNKREERIKK